MSDEPLIPLFPLGLVLYPNERLPLHIFEPRYRMLVQDCLEDAQAFGIVLFQDGRMSEIGCTARIKEVVRRYDDGRLDILVMGESRFRILEVDRKLSYLRAEAATVPEADSAPEFEARERAITQHIKLLELAGRAPSPTAYQGHEALSFFIALNAGLSVDQKQEMLELPGEGERIAFLTSHLAEFIPRVERADAFRRKISANGHFPDFPPE